MLKPYAGDNLTSTSVFRAHLCCNDHEFEANAYVVDSDGPALFGRDWLENIAFDCGSLQNINANAKSAPTLLRNASTPGHPALTLCFCFRL